MKHILIKDRLLEGKEYGTLRSFEEAVIQETGAVIVEIPDHQVSQDYLKHFAHGMNRARYRKFFPKKEYTIEADTAWCILMGPENYRLDLFKGWSEKCKTKILYLFDTLPSQYPLIKKLFSNNDWDILITSFNDAVEDLQKLTGRKWHTLEQATDISFFKPVPLPERTIHFSSYGRRLPLFHEAVKDFCAQNDLYYDYTTSVAWEKDSDRRDLYKQYAWHLNHSIFTFSWPVELTHPQRAGHLHPITCRWFEAAAAGTVMVGQAPANEIFNSVLFPDAVRAMQMAADKTIIFKQLQMLWDKKEIYHQHAADMQQRFNHQWSWNERVRRILSWL